MSGPDSVGTKQHAAGDDVLGRRRTLIVGGGIAGLALARMLVRDGVSPEVIEREPVWRRAGRESVRVAGRPARGSHRWPP